MPLDHRHKKKPGDPAFMPTTQSLLGWIPKDKGESKRPLLSNMALMGMWECIGIVSGMIEVGEYEPSDEMVQQMIDAKSFCERTIRYRDWRSRTRKDHAQKAIDGKKEEWTGPGKEPEQYEATRT